MALFDENDSEIQNHQKDLESLLMPEQEEAMRSLLEQSTGQNDSEIKASLPEELSVEPEPQKELFSEPESPKEHATKPESQEELAIKEESSTDSAADQFENLASFVKDLPVRTISKKESDQIAKKVMSKLAENLDINEILSGLKANQIEKEIEEKMDQPITAETIAAMIAGIGKLERRMEPTNE